MAQALLNLGMIAYFGDEPRLAVARLEESVRFGRAAGYGSQLSVGLAFLGRILLWIDGPRDGRAAEALDESLGLAQAAQSRYATGHALVTLGDLAWRQGNAERALAFWRQALTVRSELAERRGIAACLERLALGLAASSQFEPAAWLFGAADAQHKVLGVGLRHDEEIDHVRFVGLTQLHLGADFATAWSAGQTSTLELRRNAQALQAEAARRLPGAVVSIGVGRVQPDPLKLQHSYSEALRSLQVGRRGGGQGVVSLFADLGLDRLLLSCAATELEAFFIATLDPLLAYESAHPECGLIETLQAFLAANRNVAETARVLFVHYNTVKYRLERLEGLLGAFVNSPERCLRLGVAMHVRGLIAQGVP